MAPSDESQPGSRPDEEPRRAWDVASVYAENGDFVWRSLLRLGVSRSDVKDLAQEVFLVVHRRLDSFDGSAQMTTWLFGICLRIASDWRRKRRRRPEAELDATMEPSDPALSPEQALSRRQAQALLARVLDDMEIDKRALFVMFELEGIPCAEIASVLGVPVGTIYSRMHAARAQFQKCLERRRSET